uniref:Uncharacterized protein n=1 Tax=Anguilla anguilla TaxID=7936 RepID=A0A0E9V2H8_ANGAN
MSRVMILVFLVFNLTYCTYLNSSVISTFIY